MSDTALPRCFGTGTQLIPVGPPLLTRSYGLSTYYDKKNYDLAQELLNLP